MSKNHLQDLKPKLKIYIGCYPFICGTPFVLLAIKFRLVLKNLIANHVNIEVLFSL